MHLLDTNLKINCFFTAITATTTTTTTTTTTSTTTTTTTSKKFLLTNIDTNMMTEYEIKGIIDALDTGTSLLRLFLLGQISN